MKKFSLHFLPRNEFQVVMRTVAEDIVERYCPKTTTIVPMFSHSGMEYHFGRTVDENESTHLLVDCAHYHMEVNKNRSS